MKHKWDDEYENFLKEPLHIHHKEEYIKRKLKPLEYKHLFIHIEKYRYGDWKIEWEYYVSDKTGGQGHFIAINSKTKEMFRESTLMGVIFSIETERYKASYSYKKL